MNKLTPEQQRYYLQAMGIDSWVSRTASPIIEQPIQDYRQVTSSGLSWEELANSVANCTKRELHKTRTQTVFGVGNQNAKLLFIGEAPGANEDLQGEPFVGRAGQLLNAMLSAIELKRTDVFIANILKCRPPNNRDPKPEETTCCTPYLLRQIELLQPTLIVALGRIAAQFLLNTTTSLSKLRGQLHEYQQIPLLVTFHPAYLLRTPSEKAQAWHDFLKIKSELCKS